IPGAETLAFRDIEAFSEDVAFVLSNNNTPNARIYKTEDGGQTWTLEFQSPIAVSFYDCFAFWNRHAAIAVPDGENGHFDVIRMTDGHSWENIGDLFPPAQPGEGFFPASGTCITTRGGRRAWAVSGGAAHPRVIATTDRGDTWASYDIPIGGTPSSGGLSIAFRDNHHGIIGGGEVAAPTAFQNNFARSSDGGKTWALATGAPVPGPVFGVAYVKHSGGGSDEDDDDQGEDDGHDVRVFATGTGGTAWSPDEGDTWQALPGFTGLVSVGFATPHVGWLVGTAGQIVRVDF
ncbi:MAG TPA: sialidase family protein, partial [Myxococcaceae bacterium]|nr:sialidase family protein [Myxococcaceae bacterium]